ncbi:unnamed protein product, partial [Timema podura]|nr:unnamed protein product [Timema podura]
MKQTSAVTKQVQQVHRVQTSAVTRKVQ